MASLVSIRVWIVSMDSSYIPQNIEEKWQQRWEKLGIYKAIDGDTRPKYYSLVMFPYPSGDLHMGHMRVYTISDVISRYRRMKGFNVLNPMGWDAFGLPAENAAIARKMHPEKWTKENIRFMRDEQLKKLGTSYDWDREVTTCDQDYYHWTQWLFLAFYKKGLVDRKEARTHPIRHHKESNRTHSLPLPHPPQVTETQS